MRIHNRARWEPSECRQLKPIDYDCELFAAMISMSSPACSQILMSLNMSATATPPAREEAAKAVESIIAHWQKYGFGRWIAADKANGAFIGFGGLRSLFGTPEVVYHLTKKSWGKGFATELARAALRFGFEERGFDRIVAITKPPNTPSIRVMEKLGMQFEKHAQYYGLEVVQYSLTRDAFRWDGSSYTVFPDEAI
jgi:RimJ/RimL family protein N-acetyltransferase